MANRDEPEKPTEPPRPSRPTPARPTPKGPRAERPGAARPTPAREGAPSPPQAQGHGGGPPPPARPPGDVGGSPPPPPEADIEHTTLEVGGKSWIVRVLGRAGSGASVGITATAPLLLLGFFRSEGDEVPRREALVVGKALSELAQGQLERAFETATAPRARTGPPAEGHQDGGRGPRRRGG